jgi:hypothetical protein
MQGNKENRSFILPRILEIIEKLPIEGGIKRSYVANSVAGVKLSQEI